MPATQGTMCSLDGLALAAGHLAPEVFALKGGSGVIRRPELCSELEPITGEVGLSTHAAGCRGFNRLLKNNQYGTGWHSPVRCCRATDRFVC